jgi:anaerobic ribonucleoside-triphosphate reductase activating protein
MIKRNLQVAGKIKCSSVNGEGLRYTIFLSGCKHRCEGCHSPHTWDFKYGQSEDIVSIFNDIYLKRHYIDGVSISGGDPIEQAEDLIVLLKLLKTIDCDIWLWTGYTFDSLNDNHKELLPYLDVIIDGKYDVNKPTTKPYRGSDNQRMWKNVGGKYIEVK